MFTAKTLTGLAKKKQQPGERHTQRLKFLE
jgi:hypothetical protein